MSRLLNKPLKWFALYALLLLAASIPAYFYVVESIWFEELDEKNQIVAERIQQGLEHQNTKDSAFQKTVKVWSKLQPGTKMFPISKNNVRKTKVYTTKIYDPFEQEMERYRVLTTVVWIQDKPFFIQVSTNLQESNETITSISTVTVFFFILLLAGFIIMNFFISKRSWKPFYETLRRLKSFDLNKDKDFKLEPSKTREFNELNLEITGLLQKNLLVYDQQKRFIENASHELQTPLAILKTNIDNLIQDEQLSERNSELLETLNSTVSRISRINKNLLLLSKIENQQFDELEKINVEQIVEEALALLQDYSDSKEMTVSLDLSHCELTCNRTLFEILINNLLINAIRHGQAKDTISIQTNETGIRFINSDTQALNKELLFVRFAISTSKNTSSGLGLAIVKEICDRYNWRFSYLFLEGKHCFSIEF